jgi:hypothetical protein
MVTNMAIIVDSTQTKNNGAQIQEPYVDQFKNLRDRVSRISYLFSNPNGMRFGPNLGNVLLWNDRNQRISIKNQYGCGISYGNDKPECRYYVFGKEEFSNADRMISQASPRVIVNGRSYLNEAIKKVAELESR